MKESKILITGAGGMLGEAVYKVFNNNYNNVLATDINISEDWISFLDVRDIEACDKLITEYKPDIVLHLAAHTDLEYCELNHEDSWATNAMGAENVALLCKRDNILMVYISTAGIFDGDQEFYTDFDLPNPLSHYAKGKYYGEIYVQNHVPKHFVFRPGWMMGGGPKKDKKFINKVYKQIISGATKLYVVDDKLGTPTYTFDFANNIYRVIQTDYYGLYNQVCEGSCSRYDVAVEMIRLLNLEDKIEVELVDSDYFRNEYFAPRPYSEKLVNMKLNARNLNGMRDWKICLNEYLQEFK